MSFLTRAIELGNASTNISEEGMDSFIKSAAESDVTVNDMNMAHNLTSADVNLYTGEGVIPQDEAIEVSRLSGAVDLMVKQASVDPLSEEDAIAYLGEIGLTVDDYNEVYAQVPEDLVVKVAAEMDGTEVESELTADDEVWEKVAEAHDFLVESGLDPVESLNFAADFNEAEDAEAQDKVASEVDDLAQEDVDKIAEAVEFLSDIEGIHPADLMAEWDKVAGSKMNTLKRGLRTLSGAEVKATQKRLGKTVRSAEERYGKIRGKYSRAGDTPNAVSQVQGAGKKLKLVKDQASKTLGDKKAKRLKSRAAVGIAGGAAAGGAYAAS